MIMNRYVSPLTLALAALAWSCAPTAADAALLRFDASSYTVALGSDVNVDVIYERSAFDPPVAAFQVFVVFDTQRLARVGVTPGTALGVPGDTALYDIVGNEVAGVSLLDAADLASQPLEVRLFRLRLRGLTLGSSFLITGGQLVAPDGGMSFAPGVFLSQGITVEPGQPPVPEPATGLLALLGVASLCARRMRRA
jgi:MYXO-CTERM domain-containing protein